MYRIPSARRRKKADEKLNLVPILDCVFILIFFLLFSAEFIKVYEIGSDLPIVTEAPQPPKDKDQDKEPLNLTLVIRPNEVIFKSGDEKVLQKYSYPFASKETYPQIADFISKLKADYPSENWIIVEPHADLPYDELVMILDRVRFKIENNEKIPLFNQLVFGNVAE
jgi:biopolymer transport protein ExbD